MEIYTLLSCLYRLEGEISDLKRRWELDVAERSRESVARDVELNTLRDAEVKLRAELSQRKHDVDRFVVLFQPLAASFSCM